MLMDQKTQKERLEQEFRFLKESFEAEVISKEEFEKGKDRIESKLKESEKSEIPHVNHLEETKKENTDEKINPENSNEPEEKGPVIVGKKVEEKNTGYGEPKKDEEPENNFFKYAAVFVVLLLIAFFAYSILRSEKPELQEQQKIEPTFSAACNSDADCKQAGKKGVCLLPGTKDAKCKFVEISKVPVMVVNDRKNCFNCETQRVLNILEQWFEAIDVREIDYGTNEGRQSAEKYNATVLPLYVLSENITKSKSFEQFKQVFISKNGNYVLSEDVAASSLFINRENMPNKLDIFLISGDNASIRAEKNLQEFLGAVPQVRYDKHFSNDRLTMELGIRNFPTFLVNNRVRFSGVHTAETIKDNFCQLNKLAACEKNLSKTLI